MVSTNVEGTNDELSDTQNNIKTKPTQHTHTHTQQQQLAQK